MNNSQGKVSLPVIKRLPKYYRYIAQLHKSGVATISSSELARMMGTTASQVRQDFNCFGGFGQQGIGYNVEVLEKEIGHLLFGHGEKLPTILLGAGRLGTAVSRFLTTDTNGTIWTVCPFITSTNWTSSARPTTPPLRCCACPGRARRKFPASW